MFDIAAARCYSFRMDGNLIIERLGRERHTLNALGVASLRLFGSAARGEAGPQSDADFLVRFQGRASYDRYIALKQFLEETLGLRVDLVTEDALRPAMRESVERDAVNVA